MTAFRAWMIKSLDSATYIFLILSCVLIPLVLDNSLSNPYILSKTAALASVAIIGIALWIVRSALSKRILFNQLKINTLFAAFGVIALASVLFSDHRLTSLIGRPDYFVISIVTILSGWLIFSLANYTMTSLPRWQGIVDTIIGTGALTALGAAAKVLLDADVLAVISGGRFSTIDPMNSVTGIWFAIILILAAGQIIKKDIPHTRTILYVVAMIMTMAVLIAMNYSVIWWLLGIGLSVLVASSKFFIKEVRLGWLTTVFAIIVSIALMIVFSAPKISSPIPMEVKLNHESSWAITQGSIFSGLRNSLVGNGLGTFFLAFSHFRDSSFNNDPYAWSVRFNQPSSTFQAFLSEGGLVMSIVFILIVLFATGHIMKAIKKARGAGDRSTVKFFADGSLNSAPLVEVLMIGLAWAMLTAGMFFFFYGPVLWWLWWLLLGCFFTGLSYTTPDIFSVKEHLVADNPEYTLSLSFIAIIFIAILGVGCVGGARVYAAERNYYRFISAVNGDEMEKNLKAAVEKNPRSEQYHVALAQLYLRQATDLSRVSPPDIQQIGLLVEKAISESRRATDLSPRSVLVWQNLAAMYENATALTPEAGDWARKSLDRAYELEPTNPVIVTQLGSLMASAGNYNEAIRKFEEAVSLKPDYVLAYTGMALAYEQLKDTTKVVETYRALVSLQPNSVDIIFNYGRALYNRDEKGDRDDAEKIWLGVVAAEPKYSNALYSLGLLYEMRGEKSKALLYYRRVLELNPDNKEIKTKIANLKR